jgi:hypothetical protein
MNISPGKRRSLSVLALCLTLTLLGLPIQGAVKDDNILNAGDVLIGPWGVPGAMGETGVNDDFTNHSINTGIANVSPGGVTTAAGSVVFRNTIQNTGGADDVFTISAPIVAAGFALELSIDLGDHFTGFGAPTPAIPPPVAYRAAVTVLVRITAPAGLKILTGFDTVIRATSTLTPTAFNDTIDRLYTGFIRLEKSSTIVKPNGSSNFAAPGAVIEFSVTYSNVSIAKGVGNSLLTAHNIVISENGNAAPNNWAQTTEHIIGASDTQGGFIIGDRENSNSLTDIVTTLEPGQSGVFKFKRRIK